ncbi:transglycosylase domain-containing protein [uncultured Dubosiella sp.]|uniref:transglycosylase domain-containing protein n=1 Tax=uncultured Dubosiella sp. TaxID=1937011 RepID=UPI002597F141|nr:transglycosylase domain-containing protein [uncultured Dubosiella sp.]
MPDNPKPNNAAAPKPKRRKLDIWNKIAVCILTLFLVGCISVFFILVNIINDPEGMRFSQDGLSTLSNSRIFDGAGNLIFEFGDEIREDVTYEQIPQSLVDAFLSIEDSRFFDHNGFDLPRFIAAGIANLRSGGFAQGGSTLTMQMIDNAFTKNQEEKLTNEGKYNKLTQLKLKIQEIYLALIAEQSINKEDIFDFYVNRIWFGSGQNTRGVQKAAKYFFNKDVSELNLGEAAFLAGAINAPYNNNPLNNIDNGSEVDFLKAATERRNTTLRLMLQHGYITEEEYELAKNARLEFALQTNLTVKVDPNAAFIQQTIEECKTLTGQDPSIIPMDIYTSLNQDVQKQADEICNGNIVPFPNEAFDVGFAVIDNASGEIIAVGPGRNYHTNSERDNSKDARQPGSSMKPLLAYAPTFDILGWATTHTVQDVPKDYFTTGSNLQNSDRRYQGNMSLQDALGVSKNTTAAAAMIDLVKDTDLDYWKEYCRKLGYKEDVANDFVEQYAIGGANMFASPIEQASAYTIFGNKGQHVDAHRIRKVVRRSDQAEFASNAQTNELISEQAAFMMSTLLEKVVTGGYNNYNQILASSYPVYAKSGTSDWADDGLQFGIPLGVVKDEWSCAYTSQFSVSVWSGYTSKYQQQGYYIDIAQLNMATAFHISHYLLDYCQQYGNYHAIERPDGVSDYRGGYIKTEFVNRGDTSSAPVYDPSTACAANGGTWDDEAGLCITKQEENTDENACVGSGGTWDGGACSCPEGYELNGNACVAAEEEKPDEDKDNEQAAIDECVNNGGTYANGVCIYDTVDDPSQGGDNQGGNPGGDVSQGGDNQGGNGNGNANGNGGNNGNPDVPAGLVFPRFKGFFNLFSWL